jgi:hypothetical protein
LFVHFALGERASHFQQAVGKRGFAVVDVRDDAEIPYESWIHVTRLSPSFAIAFTFFSYRQEPLLLRTIRHARARLPQAGKNRAE